MSDVSREEWASRLLEDQLHRLGELRNANPRDAGFKLWRQTTLTVIQRIWPTDLARSERFRRIPFSTPSSKVTRTQLKECYERGCVEAGSYLRSLIQELERGGLGEGRNSPEPEIGSESGESEAPRLEIPEHELSELEITDLASEIQPHPRRSGSMDDEESDPPGLPFAMLLPSEEPPPPPAPKKLSERLGASGSGKAAKPAAPLSARPPASPTSGKQPPAGPPTRPASSPAPRPEPAPPIRLEDRRALKDMLGFGQQGGAPTPTPAAKGKPGAPPPRSQAPPLGAPQEEYEIEPEETAEEEPIEREQPRRRPVRPAPETNEPDLAIQFLSQSPVMRASAKPPSGARHQATPPVRTPKSPEPIELSEELEDEADALEEGSPAAAALTALAVEVAALGVPPGKRATTRAALLDLARALDQRTATWEALRDVLSTALDHPQLARRVVPLLVPYLDLE